MSAQVHTLKLAVPFFEAVKDGRKTFEVRINDRGYQAGDTVLLREYDESYPTHDKLWATIGYVLPIREGLHPSSWPWVVFSLLDVRATEESSVAADTEREKGS